MGENTIKIRIGRGSFNDIVVDDESVLMEHCYIINDKTGYRVVNLKKDSKTFINDEEINWEADLAPEDRLRVGNSVVDWKNIPDKRKKEELPPGEEYVEIPYGMDPMIDIESATEPNTATNKGNGRDRNGFVTFWIVFCIIGNILSIPLNIVVSKKIFGQFTNLIGSNNFIDGLHNFEWVYFLSVLCFCILNIVFLNKLLHWKKIGFWGFAVSTILSNIVTIAILKFFEQFIMSHTGYYFVGLEKVWILSIVSSVSPTIVMWAVLQIRCDGVSCWKQLYWKKDLKKEENESEAEIEF